MTPPGRKPLHGEDGFALIEVLVSALILAIVAAGVMAVLQATTRSAADERRHAEGFAIAQEDQARLRSMRLSALNRLSEERSVTLEGNSFTVKSEGVFVNNSTSQPSSCTSGATSADYVRITSTVNWDSHANRPPIVMQSIVSPSNGSLDPNHGTLVITTKNAAGEPLSGVGLSATGVGTFTGTSDSTGCANFTDLPAGNYSVTPTSAGLVDLHGDTAKALTTSVVAGGTNTFPILLDYGASLPVEFERRVGSSSTYAPAKVDSLYVYNVLMNPAKPYWAPGKVRTSSITATPVFPFTSPDTVYAGACAVNDPGVGVGEGSVTLSPGKTYAPTLKLKVPALELTVKNGSSAISGATVMITDENCEPEGKTLTRTYTTESLGHQSSASNGTAEYALPYGTYEICASGVVSSHSRRLYSKKVKVQSFTSSKVESLDIAGNGSEKDRACP